MASLSPVSSYVFRAAQGAAPLTTSREFLYVTVALTALSYLPQTEAYPFGKCMEWCTKLPLGHPFLLGGGCLVACSLGLTVPYVP